jgi:hypothetical protein
LTSVVFVVDVLRKSYFVSTRHQVLKNSLHGQISIDFDAVALKILENFELNENGRLKN